MYIDTIFLTIQLFVSVEMSAKNFTSSWCEVFEDLIDIAKEKTEILNGALKPQISVRTFILRLKYGVENFE